MKSFGKFIRKHKFLTVLVVLFVAGAIVFACLPKAKVTYSEETVTLRDIVTYNSFVGNMQPASDTMVVAKASEMVKVVYFEDGDEVKKGDLLAELDTEALDYTIWKTEKNLGIAEATYDYNYDTAPTPAYGDFLDKTTWESLKISEKDLERLKETKKDYSIYAPADGIITYWNLTEGAPVTTGMRLQRSLIFPACKSRSALTSIRSYTQKRDFLSRSMSTRPARPMMEHLQRSQKSQPCKAASLTLPRPLSLSPMRMRTAASAPKSDSPKQTNKTFQPFPRARSNTARTIPHFS